jgi:hypothetical protein
MVFVKPGTYKVEKGYSEWNNVAFMSQNGLHVTSKSWDQCPF